MDRRVLCTEAHTQSHTEKLKIARLAGGMERRKESQEGKKAVKGRKTGKEKKSGNEGKLTQRGKQTGNEIDP